MKIGKKTWICGTASIALAAILTWALLPEYGKGYSEDQRRNWNGTVVKKDSYTGTNRMRALWMPYDYSSIGERRSQPDAPEWSISLPSRSSENLPLEGMLFPDLERLAEQGNGDACLELVFRILSSDGCDFINEYPLDNIYRIEKYLRKAVELRRPGSDFLFRLFDVRKRGVDGLSLQSIEGYQFFLSCMDQGDFRLGKIYLYLAHDGEDVLSRLDSALTEKAKKGDAHAERDKGHLFFLRKVRRDSTNYSKWSISCFSLACQEYKSIYEKIENSSNFIESILPVLSPFVRKVDKEVCELLVTQAYSSMNRRMKEPLEFLWRASEKGDLHAKYLWCQYAVCIHLLFSREQWERYVGYVDELGKAGGVYSNWVFGTDLMFPQYFYQEESFSRRAALNYQLKQQEYESCFPDVVNWELMGIDIDASNPKFNFMHFFKEENIRDETEDKKKHAYKILKRQAMDRVPWATVYFSQLCNEGKIVESDVHQLWKLLQESGKYVKEIDSSIKSDGMIYFWRDNSPGKFDAAVEMQKIEIVARHGDMPGMTLQEAFDQFLNVISDRKNNRISSPAKEDEEKLLIIESQFEKRGFKIPEDKK